MLTLPKELQSERIKKKEEKSKNIKIEAEIVDISEIKSNIVQVKICGEKFYQT